MKMLKTFAEKIAILWVILLVLSITIAVSLNLKEEKVQAQTVIEVACPAGLAPWQSLTTRNPVTGGVRQYGCIDSNGTLNVPILFNTNTTNTNLLGAKILIASGTLSGGTLTVSFNTTPIGSFTSGLSFRCFPTSETANSVRVNGQNSSSVTFTGTLTDSFDYFCIGN